MSYCPKSKKSKMNTTQNFIPNGTSTAGLCLTAANWQEVMVGSIAYYLDSLFVKPGYALVKQIPDLARYLGCSGDLILNASRLWVNKEGIFTLRSPFDGSELKITYFQLIEIIQHIKPVALILPKKIVQEFPEIWDNWNDEITPFIASDDLLKQELSRVHGVYLSLENLNAKDTFLDQVKKWSHLPRYVTGFIGLDLMEQLKNEGIEWIESDEPAAAAMQGIVFSRKGLVNLTDSQEQMQFETIDPECACPTCSQLLTKAYLHHLFLHTPLLCQRFLIQHNVYYWTLDRKT
jgi:queuine tRNA-ribosyltransferase